MSFFSIKKPSDQSGKASPLEPGVVVRTMRGDVENMKRNGGKKLAFPLAEREKEQAVLNQGRMPVEKLSNPFTKEEGKAPSIQAEKKEDLNSGLLLKEAPVEAKKSNLLVVSIVGMIILLLLAGGIYYYFLVRGDDLVEQDSIDSMKEVVPLPVTQTPKELPYALDKPNYLSVNTETVSPTDIQKVFYDTASRIKGASIATPVEFLITDQSNNPLAFSRFAFLLDIKLSPETLALVGEVFSVYIYDDAGFMRVGLALPLRDQSTAILTLSRSENMFPAVFQGIFLEQNISIPENMTFKSSMHKDFSVRYVNIDIAKNLSFDYAVTNNHWYIGTSKNTLRVLLDAIKP